MTSIEEDVAALRAAIEKTWDPDPQRPALRAALNRIAAQVPQRAMGASGLPLFQHSCGATGLGPAQAGCPYCTGGKDEWQPLYVLDGRAS